MYERRSRIARYGAVATAAATLAMVGTSVGSSGAASPKASTPVTTLVYSTQAVSTPQQIEQNNAIDAQFEKAYPSIKIDLVAAGNEIKTVIGTQLRSGSGPDVLAESPGPAFIGALAQAGLVYNLSSAYKTYGWDKTIYPWALSSVTTNGKLYAIPDEVDEIGVYYNKAIFKKYGIGGVPSSLTQLEADAAKLKKDGVDPIVFPDQEGWEGGHLLSEVLSSVAGAKYMSELESGQKSWNTPPVVKALTIFFKDFSTDGYFELDPLGVNYNDGNSLFYSGKAAMDPTGEWLLASVASSSKFPFGYFAFPAPNGPGIFADGIGAAVFINAHTKHLQAALTFLNWMQSATYGRWQAQTYDTIPAFAVSLSGLTLSPVFKQMVANSQVGNVNPALVGSNIDVTTDATFDTALYDDTQAVLSGSKTPQQAAQLLEAAFVAKS
jgi:raffinose/stachyose/melibiose transport system substrate-binding protein